MKLWLKATAGDKLVHSVVTQEFGDAAISAERIASIMRDALAEKDMPTPNVMHANVMQLARFNVTRFRPEDFVESVDFDLLTAELLRSDEEKRPHRRTPLDEA